MAPLHVLVLGDSIAYQGPAGALTVDDPRLYPNVARRRLERLLGRPVELTVICRAGSNTRSTWVTVTKDVHVRDVLLPKADVVVLASSSIDMLPVGLPIWLKDAIGHITHPGVRRRVRKGYVRAHPRLARLLGRRLRWVPRSVTNDLWPRTVDWVRYVTGGALVVGFTTVPTAAPYHGGRDPHSAQGAADIRELAAAKGVPLVDVTPMCRAHMGAYNPDGMHWGFDLHAEVGEALAQLLAAEIKASKSAMWTVPG